MDWGVCQKLMRYVENVYFHLLQRKKETLLEIGREEGKFARLCQNESNLNLKFDLQTFYQNILYMLVFSFATVKLQKM